MLFLRSFIFCFFAALFFAVLLNAPRRALLPAAVLGAVGYLVYTLCLAFSARAGFFLGTLAIAVGAEVLARVLKHPALLFMIPAVIPLVPGMGLYNTMLALVQSRIGDAVAEGSETMLALALMAAALALTTFAFRLLAKQKSRAKGKKVTCNLLKR